jgi:hypothetical protein
MLVVFSSQELNAVSTLASNLFHQRSSFAMSKKQQIHFRLSLCD